MIIAAVCRCSPFGTAGTSGTAGTGTAELSGLCRLLRIKLPLLFRKLLLLELDFRIKLPLLLCQLLLLEFKPLDFCGMFLGILGLETGDFLIELADLFVVALVVLPYLFVELLDLEVIALVELPYLFLKFLLLQLIGCIKLPLFFSECIFGIDLVQNRQVTVPVFVVHFGLLVGQFQEQTVVPAPVRESLPEWNCSEAGLP